MDIVAQLLRECLVRWREGVLFRRGNEGARSQRRVFLAIFPIPHLVFDGFGWGNEPPSIPDAGRGNRMSGNVFQVKPASFHKEFLSGASVDVEATVVSCLTEGILRSSAIRCSSAA